MEKFFVDKIYVFFFDYVNVFVFEFSKEVEGLFFFFNVLI